MTRCKLSPEGIAKLATPTSQESADRIGEIVPMRYNMAKNTVRVKWPGNKSYTKYSRKYIEIIPGDH